MSSNSMMLAQEMAIWGKKWGLEEASQKGIL